MTELSGDQIATMQEHVQQLEIALVSNRVITTAVGLAMGQHRVDRQRAFAMLVEQSQRTDTRLATVALDVVAQAECDASRDCA